MSDHVQNSLLQEMEISMGYGLHIKQKWNIHNMVASFSNTFEQAEDVFTKFVKYIRQLFSLLTTMLYPFLSL